MLFGNAETMIFHLKARAPIRPWFQRTATTPPSGL